MKLNLPQLFFLVPILISVNVSGQNKYIPPDPYISWDGVTHKSSYQITSPGYMGPNALPVPLVHTGQIKDNPEITLGYEYIIGTGNVTHSAMTRMTVPFENKRIALELNYNPLEFFTMDSVTSRLWRTYTGESVTDVCLGDFYFGTVIQLIRDHRYLPDLAVSMNCKTASGRGREYSRHTNAPGYYMDLSIGDTYKVSSGSLLSVRWYASGGLLVWQTNLALYPQDDALLFGAGVNLDLKGWFINLTFRGYSGYMNNGDRPLMYRADLGIKIGHAALVLSYEKGFRDYPFHSFQGALCINLPLKIV